MIRRNESLSHANAKGEAASPPRGRLRRAQQAAKVPRIGYLSPGSASPRPLAYHDEIRRGLRELVYVEGRNLVIEYRFADGKFDRLAALAAELVQLNVDVIVSVVTQASLAPKNATGTIPIVVVSVGDPVGAGNGPGDRAVEWDPCNRLSGLVARRSGSMNWNQRPRRPA